MEPWRARQQREGRCLDCRAVKPDVRGRVPRCDACRRAFNQRRADAYAAASDAGLCVCCKTRPRVPHDRLDIFCAHCLARYLARQRRQQAVA